MNVGELRRLIAHVDDDVELLIEPREVEGFPIFVAGVNLRPADDRNPPRLEITLCD
jgi:hypothetical protein